MPGSVSQVVFGGKSRRIGCSALEQSLSLGIALHVDQNPGVVVRQDRVAGICGDKFGVEGSRLVKLLVSRVKTGKKACDRRVLGMGNVQFFRDRQRLGGLALLLVERSQLGVEGWIIRILGERGRQESLSLLWFLLMQKEMGQGGGCIAVLRVGFEQSAVGGFGCGIVARRLGQLSGEKNVVRSLRGEFECLREARRWRRTG